MTPIPGLDPFFAAVGALVTLATVALLTLWTANEWRAPTDTASDSQGEPRRP